MLRMEEVMPYNSNKFTWMWSIGLITALAGCNTISGVGKDIAATGRFIDEGGQRTEEALFGPSEPQQFPAAAAIREDHVIYFDSGSASLNDDGDAIIQAMAADSKNRTGRIEIAGFADTAGSTSYNEELSRQRAEAVANALTAQGVSRSDIDVTWHGETQLSSPTANGVAAPSNRRVVLNFES